jgi:hypothetical protein
MWYLDFPEYDPDENYAEPGPKQLLYAEQARRELERLKSTLERLTVPQQRVILGELSGSVFRREPAVIGASRA